MSISITLLRLAKQSIANNPSLKVEIDSALKEISDNPFVDAATKFYYPVLPAIISLYKKDNLWVLYRLNDACSQADIWNIGKQEDKVTFR